MEENFEEDFDNEIPDGKIPEYNANGDLIGYMDAEGNSYGPDDAVGDTRLCGCDDGCLCMLKHFDIDFVALVSLVDPFNRVAAPKYINY